MTNVVGQNGIRVQSKARNDDGELDFVGNQIIEREWKKWCKHGNCTIDGKMSFIDAQKLFIETYNEDVWNNMQTDKKIVFIHDLDIDSSFIMYI